MKNLFSLVLVAAMAMPVVAQESEKKDNEATQHTEARRGETSVWPAFFAACNFPANPDVVGLRLTIPFADRQCNVTGLDVGIWGKSTYFEGIQINVLRSDVKDDMAGFQIGCYNSVGGGDLFGIQAGLWNEANYMRGFQVGLVNLCGETRGLQVGIINRSETMYGYQVGLINIIRDAELQFFPVLNIGF